MRRTHPKEGLSDLIDGADDDRGEVDLGERTSCRCYCCHLHHHHHHHHHHLLSHHHHHHLLHQSRQVEVAIVVS